jgi:hypothetical protein
MREERSPLGLVIGGLGPIAVACLLVPLRDVIDNANVALALVVVVIVAGVVGGRAAGALAAVVAVLSFDFFHTQPYLSLTIDSRDDVVTALLLLVVGGVAGTVSSRAATARSSADLGHRELRRIHRVAEMMVAGGAAVDVIRAAQDEMTALLSLASCRFETPPYDEARPRLERNGVIAGTTKRRLARGGFELPAQGVELAVLARGQEIGRFVMVPKPDVGLTLDERVVAVALADQVGAAIAGDRPQSPVLLREREDTHG